VPVTGQLKVPPTRLPLLVLSAFGHTAPKATVQSPDMTRMQIQIEFKGKYADKAKTASVGSLDRQFSPRLKYHMEYCMNNPGEISKIHRVKAKVDEVKGIMVQNIERVRRRAAAVPAPAAPPPVPRCLSPAVAATAVQQAHCAMVPCPMAVSQVHKTRRPLLVQVLERGERIEVIVDKTEDLQNQADQFRRQGRDLRNRMWWQNMKVKLLVCGVLVLLAIVIFCSVCFSGGNCLKHK
jgi:Synaptobrevin